MPIPPLHDPTAEASASIEARARTLELALEAGHQGLYDLNVVTGEAVVNAEYASMLGYDPATFRETNAAWLARLHPDDTATVGAAYHDYVEGRSPEYRVEFRQRTATGGWKWILSVGRIVARTPDGRPLRMLGTHTDISPLKESEAALALLRRRAEAMLALHEAAQGQDDRAFLQFGLDAIESLTESAIAFLHFVDDEAETIELVTWSQATLRDACHAAYDRHYPVRVAGIWADAFRRRAPVVFNDYAAYPHKHGLPEGHAPLVRLASVPVQEGGRVRMLTGVGNKATPYTEVDVETVRLLSEAMWHIVQRRRAETSLRVRGAALEAAAAAIVVTDADGRYEWANPAYFELSGQIPLELEDPEAPSPIAPRAGPEASADPAVQSLWESVRAGQTWSGELLQRRRDGRTYPEALSVTPVRGPDGSVRHCIAFKRDLTAERALQTRLAQSEKMESVGRLAGGVAHDFNNLLTVITGTVDLALRGLRKEDPLRGDLTEVMRACDRASTLTRQLLVFSRQQVVRLERLELGAVVADLARMLERLIGDDVRLVTELAPGLGAVRADRGQLEQMIVNLVVNARDALPCGGTVSVHTADARLDAEHPLCRAGHSPGDYVRLTVRDDGVGMDEATVSHIFEPFFTTKPVGQGTGLGLATVYGVVQACGGCIHVDSRPNHGTRFDIYLPLATDAPGEARTSTPGGAAPAPAEPSVVRANAGSAPPVSILVVDDEPAVLSVAARVLRREGYVVTMAPNGVDALARFGDAGTHIDLLLTDVVMPGMSGPELATRLAAHHPEMRVLFTSGYTGDEVRRRGLTADHLLPKPYVVDELLSAVRAVLRDGRLPAQA